jgi:hypothetical protein
MRKILVRRLHFARTMRRVCGIVIVLSALGWFACRVEVPSAKSPLTVETGWRRTVDGWESPYSWSRTAPSQELPLHPAVVASAELLFCLLALVAIPSAAAVAPATQTTPSPKSVR